MEQIAVKLAKLQKNFHDICDLHNNIVDKLYQIKQKSDMWNKDIDELVSTVRDEMIDPEGDPTIKQGESV